MSWLTVGLAVAEELVEKNIEGQFEKSIALEGLEFLKDHSDDLVLLGKIALKKGLVHKAVGDLAPAKDWASRQAQRRAAQGKAYLEKKEADEAWEFLEEIGLGALRAALPFILAAL